MRVSCVVRAHPKRADLVDELLDRLDQAVTVVWDEHHDSWDTGARAWAAVDKNADWGIVLEDDAWPCRDLLAGLELALDHMPIRSVVSLYLGNQTATDRFDLPVRRAERTDATWIQMRTLVWGVGFAVPTRSVHRMLQWCGQKRHATVPYDTRVARYYANELRWPAYYTWPSLVDHRQVPSLLRHQLGRYARRFLGDASAVDVDWRGPIVDSLSLGRRR